MKNDKYSHIDEVTAFGFLINALEGGGDRARSFPRSDAEDLSRGLRFIPGEVTLARRQGERVVFTQNCSNPCCWYWQFQDGSRTYYWERGAFELNGGDVPCQQCGNEHTSGGHIKA